MSGTTSIKREMTPEEALNVALHWAGLGVPSFPVGISYNDEKHGLNKRPLTPHGFQDATTDRDTLTALFEAATPREDEGWGVGLWLGPAGLMAVDIDRKKGIDGYASLDQLEAIHGPLPETFTVSTPSGGEHRWFRKGDREISNRSLARGIDVRADSGFVVAPGTYYLGGSWDGQGDRYAEVPAWVPEEQTRARTNGHARNGVRDLAIGDEPILEGERDNKLTSIAGYLRRIGVSENGIRGHLHDVNYTKCQPPLPDEDIARIATSATRWDPDVTADDALELAELARRLTGEEPDPGVLKEFQTLKNRREAQDLLNELDERRGDDRRQRFLTLEELLARPEPEWAVDGLIPEYGVGQLFGESRSGKTFLALDLVLTLATFDAGHEWYGFPIRRPSPVAYVAMEGGFDLGKRVQAWRTRNGRPKRPVLALVEEHLDLCSEVSVDRLRRELVELGPAARPGLLVIDTQSLATPGRDENSNTVMALAMSLTKKLAEALRCFVLLVHHTGWEATGRMRGASAQLANLDVVIEVSGRANADRRMKVTKVKAGRDGQVLPFALEQAGDSLVARPRSDDEVQRDQLALLAEAAREQVDLERRIIAFVEANPNCSKEAVRRSVGRNKEVVSSLIDEMLHRPDAPLVNVSRGRYAKLRVPDHRD